MAKKKSIFKSVMFTDMKNFSLKTSLLTNLQLNVLLDVQGNIISNVVDKYHGQIIKTIGDSFMIIFNNPLFSILTAIEIQEALGEYNKNKKIDLFKVEIRISISYGVINRKNTFKGLDYFGDTVNLSSRILSTTPEKCIFIGLDYFGDTVNLSSRILSTTPEKCIFICGYLNDKIKDISYINTYLLGGMKYKGFIDEKEIYEVIYKKDEIRLNISGKLTKAPISNVLLDNKLIIREKKVEDLIFKVSSVIAVISLQPVPIINSTTIIPMQLYLINEIGKIYNIEDKKDILLSGLISVFSFYSISQGSLGISKIGLPIVGGYIIMPINFALTYGLGKTINQYFYYKSNDLELNNENMEILFKESTIKGKKIIKTKKAIIIKTGNDFKNRLLSFIKKY